jgi:hypothetical protein
VVSAMAIYTLLPLPARNNLPHSVARQGARNISRPAPPSVGAGRPQSISAGRPRNMIGIFVERFGQACGLTSGDIRNRLPGCYRLSGTALWATPSGASALRFAFYMGTCGVQEGE